MADHVVSDDELAPAPATGGRTCPVAITKVSERGPWGTRRTIRVLRSTGVISADVVAGA